MPGTVAIDVLKAAGPQRDCGAPDPEIPPRGGLTRKAGRPGGSSAGTVERAFRFAVLAGLLLAAIACGDRTEDQPDATPPAPNPRTLVCPINDARFPQGQGVAIHGPGGIFEVCSKACQYQYELEPEAYPEAGR